jgi:uncharacterized protein (DUF2062 family)
MPYTRTYTAIEFELMMTERKRRLQKNLTKLDRAFHQQQGLRHDLHQQQERLCWQIWKTSAAATAGVTAAAAAASASMTTSADAVAATAASVITSEAAAEAAMATSEAAATAALWRHHHQMYVRREP